MNRILDPYALLGIPAGSSIEDVNRTARKLIDRLTLADKAGSVGARAQLEQIKQAQNLLSDLAKKRSYDREMQTNRLRAGFRLHITPSKRVVTKLAESQVVYILIDVIPEAYTQDVPLRRDGGMNLTLVLDHSNSMNGMRLDKVKVAATEIIDQLSENDYLSVVGFNDRAEIIIDATRVEDKKRLASRTRMTRASGGTEIYQGLHTGVQENRKYSTPDRINHIILLTDGNTYGDEDKCIELAKSVVKEGISISTLGLGSEWNDEFLDRIASITGGSSGFIRSARSVVTFMNSHVQNLSNLFAERVQMSVSTDPDVNVEMAFKIRPSPQPIVEQDSAIQLGGIQAERNIGVIMQIEIPPDMPMGFHSLARFVVSGDILSEQRTHVAVSDFGIEVIEDIVYEDPPDDILDALGKLTLYRMQEHANEAMERGDFKEATQRLKNLATRLLDMGHDALAEETMNEVRQIETTHMLSEEGRKSLKYQTRHLISPDAGNEGEDIEV